MRGIIIIGDENLSLETIAKMQFDDCITCFDEEKSSIVLTTAKGGIYFDYAENIIDYYDNGEVQKISGLGCNINELTFVTIDYGSKNIFYTIMLKLRSICLLVDDDHGNIMTYDDYINVLYLEILSNPND